ncbi:MAG: ABC transporter substrate-binding protein [Chloroflexi bacterium]|nr:MAG: ABC transporter substrate-binding protein [Chloroflexota bacterium]
MMNTQRFLYGRIIIVLMLAFLLVGTAITGSAQEPQRGGVLRLAINPIEGTLDPAFSSNNPDATLSHSVYDFLIEPLPDGSIAPNLATDWTVSDDGLTYTFNLRQGVTFHDGTPFTSADVAFTFNRLLDEELGSPALDLLSSIESIETPDDFTVVMNLSAPNPDFLSAGVGSRFTLILKNGTEDPNDPAQIIGTGPFVLTSYSQGDRAILTRNENYWIEDQPYLDGMEHIYVPDTAAQAEILRSGEADLIYSVPLELAESLAGEEDVEVVTAVGSQHTVVRIHADEGPGADPRVREAFKFATNREELNELVLFGRGTVANNDPIAPSFPDFYPGDVTTQEHDPERACELLAEAGFPDGLSGMTLEAPDSLEIPTLATLLQQQWAEGCINVDINIVPVSNYYGSDQWLDTPLGITGWGSRPSPQVFLDTSYASDGIWNESRWSDEELDALIEQARTTVDVDERAAIFARIAEIFNERGPVIIPYFQPGVGAHRSNVHGVNLHPFVGLTDFRTVWISE